MKRILLTVIILIYLSLLGCQNKGVEKEYIKPETRNEEVKSKDDFTDSELNHYLIEASLDPDTSVITARQVIEYTNSETIDLSEIYMHLYPNAFSKESQPSIIGNTDTIDKMHGKIEISSIMVNDEVVVFEEGPEVTTIKIPYDFKQKESYIIELDYVVRVSSTSERFGVVKDIYNLGNWYPIIAVYDEDGWNLDPYLSIGDPFYSDVSNYDVIMTVPKDYTIAGSGYLYDIQTKEEQESYSFRADRMRDFAFVISNQFEYMKETVNNTDVYLYYPKDIGNHKWIDDALLFGAESIRSFEQIIGDYPYKSYSVVLTNFPSGMEYPGLVFISTDYFTRGLDALRSVIVHETAHQWFYGIIGDDEIDEGWIDEGLTTYFTAYFDIEFTGQNFYDDTMARYLSRVNDYGFINIEVAKTSYEFDNWGDYGVAAYTKPALMYHEIYTQYGDEKIQEFAKYLYTHYAYGILKEEDLIEALVTVYGQEIQELLNTWLY